MIHEPAVLQDWLEDIICGTSTKTNALKEFESQQPRRNICTNLSKMVKVL